MSVNVREAALNSIIRCEKDGRYSNIELDAAIKKYSLEGVDRAFFTALVYGVIEKSITLDYIISKYSKYELNELDTFVLNILRLGAYQALYLDRTPDFAVVNESVEMAKRRCKESVGGFVNAVLRSIIRNRDSLPMPDKSDRIKYYSIKYSLPEWMVELWCDCLGKSEAEKIMEGLNRRPHITLRVNTLKISRDELIEKLKSEGISVSAASDCDSAVVLDTDCPIDALHIDDGLCYVQDISSQLCVKALDAHPDSTVIDTCSCPGGKSFGAAIDMENRGRVISLDLHKNKLSLIEKGAEKMGIGIIETREQDGTKYFEDYEELADYVLCDVPCSGLGVIAKKPDLRRKKAEDVERLPKTQYAILKNCCRYVKNGGTLVYSTCTLNPAENEDIAERFASENKSFELLESRTIFPSFDRDGFYYALFKKLPL